MRPYTNGQETTMVRFRHQALLAMAILSLAVNVFAAAVYVDQDATGKNNGTSWANAYTELQPAITTTGSGKEIWVAAGTYKPTSYPNGGKTSRYMHFSLKNGVAVYGGFVGTEVLRTERNPAANPTLLSGDIGVVGTASDNCYHVFYHPDGLDLDATAILDGFTITAGNASSSDPHDSGAGIYNGASSPTLANCTFAGNTAMAGGGIHNTLSSAPTITGCTFDENSATYYGGGIYNISSTPTIVNCTFIGNVARYGGGIYNFSSPAVIANGTFKGNMATTIFGGDIYNASSSPTVRNSIFWGNPAPIAGGTPTVSYCVVQGGFAGGTDIITDDPRLGPLADNGGPTMTCAVPMDSSAVAIPESAGGNWNGCPATDQRGYARPSSGLRAVGAYQPGVGKPALQTAPVTDNTGTDAVSGGTYIEESLDHEVVSKGLCWGTEKNPTLNDAHVECGDGFAPFSSPMTELTPGVVYHVRAYAQLDDDSVVFGQDIPFKTTRRAYVVPGGAGAMDGSSWVDAYGDLQVAIENATEVWVAGGTYRPTSWPNGGSTGRHMHFSLRNDTAVHGGFAGTETLLSQRNAAGHHTILDGDIGVAGTAIDNCYHLFYHPGGLGLDATAILDGVTVTAGNANGSSPHNTGGGMYNNGSSPTVTNCTFSGNSATGGGGGIYNFVSSPSVTNCTVSGNSSHGMYNSSSSPTLTNCTFGGNQAGGILNDSSSSPTVKNCLLWGNSTAQISGGTPIVSYCVVQGGFADGTNIIAADPLLGALADHGGPTLTRAILRSSSAMAIPESAGGNWNDCPDTDQRGHARTASGFRAIGTFEPVEHVLRYEAGDHGTINGPTPQTVWDGEDGEPVTADPDPSYHLVEWSDGSTENPRTDTSVSGNITVTATFSNVLALNYLAGASGSVTGQTAQTVIYGEDGSEVVAVPDLGHHFVQWSDGVLTASRTDLGVTDNISATAQFAIDTFSVIFHAGANGSLTGASIQTVEYGSNATSVTANPEVGHHLVDWTIDSGAGNGTIDTGANPLRITGVVGNIEVTANFAINEYRVEFRTDGTVGASLTGVSVQTVTYGADCTPVEALPPVGVEFIGWLGDYAGEDNPLTITHAVADMTITAHFGNPVAQGATFAVLAATVDLGEFTARPKVYAVYANPVTGKAGQKATAKAVTKVSANVPTDTIVCEWTRKIKLFNTKGFAAAQKLGETAEQWLGIVANQQPLIMSLHVGSKQADPADRPIRSMLLRPPVIDDIQPGDPDPKGNDTLVITGTWFGTKKPKVWREYVFQGKNGDVVKHQAMKIVKPAVDNTGYLDSAGKPACMDPATGESQVIVVVPAKEPRGGLNGLIVLENGVGLGVGTSP